MIEPRDHLIRAGLRAALPFRLQGDKHAALIRRRIGPARPDIAGDRLHGGILQHGADDGQLLLREVGDGNVLRTLGDAEDQAGILLREEALGRCAIEIAGQHDRAEQRRERNPLMAQHLCEQAVITGGQPLKPTFQREIHPTVTHAAGWRAAQQHRREHRRQRQRNDGRNGDRHGDGDGEFMQQPADDAVHQQQGDEHGHQGDRDREDRKADLAGAFQGGVERRLTLLQMMHDVLDHDDRIVDDKADRDRQPHEREIIEGKAEHIHDRKRPDDG